MVDLENKQIDKKEKKESQMTTLKGKVDVMLSFLEGIKKVGITPEAVFRIADFGYKNVVESDYFRVVIAKMRLGLNPKEISCLIFILDENCTGFISKE